MIRFGRTTDASAPTFSVGLPVVAGTGCESLFPGAHPVGGSNGLVLFHSGEWLLGWGSTPITGGLDTVTTQIYHEVIAATRGRHLCRIWNYVPAINAPGPDGIENYRAFSRGRSLAFEAAAGPEFKRWLPAASAVGSTDEQLAIVFAASRAMPLHRENPHQVPAYEYPLEHGPRPPSFARATIVPRLDGHRDVFISGTSAVKGHATIAPGDTLAQTRCTLENLRTISSVCGLGDDLGAGRAESRHMKVYLRHAEDHALVAAAITPALVRTGDSVTYLVADICRAALNVEIEVTLLGVL